MGELDEPDGSVLEFVLIIIGFVLLIKASDYFVDASTDIAKIFKVSEIVIGATIVSIGTTLPETMVSATSAFRGHGDIAYGNAIGSIICNTALISALTLIFAPSVVNKKALKVPVTFFFASFAFYVVFAYVFKGFSRISGIILVSIFIIYVFYIIYSNKSGSKEIDKVIKQAEIDIEEIKEGKSIDDNSSNNVIKSVFVIIVSAIVIAFASNLLVDNGTLIAKKFGVPESVIGLTMIALGTSLPELSTAITSLVKGHSNLSIGNVIGANFFNVVLVTGLASIVGPFKIPDSKVINGINASLLVDVPVAIAVMLILCVPSLIYGKTRRWQGIVLICMYVMFLIYQFKF